jgi:signal transduction histidine kinase
VKTSTGRIRLQLTVWYIAVFAIIIGAFGTALYAVIDRQRLTGIDAELERAVDKRTRLVLARRIPTNIAQDSLLYDREVYVFREGKPFSPEYAPDWIQQFALEVLKDSLNLKKPVLRPDGVWIAYGKRFRGLTGASYATIAVAQNRELLDMYPSIIRGFALSALLALVLTGIGAAALAGKSIQPIERAFEQMRRFMGDAAHELKTPVAVLRARADVGLQRTRTELEYQETLNGIAAEAKRLGNLVENMLLLARADAGQWPVTRSRVFLDDVLLDAASAARALGVTKGVNVDVGALEETPVVADPELLRQLFMILLDNAVNFTPEGGSVTASAQRNGTSCKVTIADTGIGIPADSLSHVFDRFYRADAARGRAGAGLGLSIARWIVGEHQAEIWLESEEGKGTVATVSFPVA